MKKNLIMVLAAIFVLAIAATAFAAPISYDGQISAQYRQNTFTNVPDMKDDNNTIYKLVINGKGESFIPNTDFYFRIGASSVSNPNTTGRDFNTNVYDTSAFAIDQFGFVHKNAGWTYKLGRQDAVIGATGLLYDNTAYVGRYSMVDGLIISGKAGVADIVVAAVQADSLALEGTPEVDAKVYVAAANFALTKDFKLGATFARVAGAADPINKNIWAVNTSYAFGKATFAAEYAKASVTTVGPKLDKAYDYGISYDFDGKNSVSVTAFKVENNADVAYLTTFDNGGKGMYYGFNHKFDKTTSLNFFYKDVEDVSDATMKNTSFRTTVAYKF